MIPRGAVGPSADTAGGLPMGGQSRVPQHRGGGAHSSIWTLSPLCEQSLRVPCRVKKVLVPRVPDPKVTFPGLFESHHGNFQVSAITLSGLPWGAGSHPRTCPGTAGFTPAHIPATLSRARQPRRSSNWPLGQLHLSVGEADSQGFLHVGSLEIPSSLPRTHLGGPRTSWGGCRGQEPLPPQGAHQRPGVRVWILQCSVIGVFSVPGEPTHQGAGNATNAPSYILETRCLNQRKGSFQRHTRQGGGHRKAPKRGSGWGSRLFSTGWWSAQKDWTKEEGRGQA